ncbi:MAG: hypothetical protein QM662_08470 [Gordonia sp. (in: high G+C Gram-positive bacteria)]
MNPIPPEKAPTTEPDSPGLDQIETEQIGRIATPGRVAFTMVPIVLMVLTPLLPFAQNPTRWFGLPAVLVWAAVLVIASVATLQVVDRLIARQAAAAGASS